MSAPLILFVKDNHSLSSYSDSAAQDSTSPRCIFLEPFPKSGPYSTIMPGGGVVPVTGTADVNRVEAPVTVRAYLIVAFAAFGGIFFGYDTGWMGGVLKMVSLQHHFQGRIPH